MTPRQRHELGQHRTRDEAKRDCQLPYLNCFPGFWGVFAMPPGSARREKLLEFFQQRMDAVLPVNNKWQAQVRLDSDLQHLLKKNILRQVRGGGYGRKKSGKRQTYLRLAPALQGCSQQKTEKLDE